MRDKFILCFFTFLLILNIASAKDTEINTNINVKVESINNYQLSVINNIDTHYWTNKDWSVQFGKEINNLVISDAKGVINIKNEKVLNNDYIEYKFDTNYQISSNRDYQPIYFKGSGNVLQLNDALYLIDLKLGSFATEKSDENINLNIELPPDFKFLSVQNYNSYYNEAKYNFSYKNFYGNYKILIVDSKNFDNFVKIEKDNKIFLVENNTKLLKDIEKTIENKDLIFDYPTSKNDFIVIGLVDLSSFNKDNIDTWGVTYENKLILLDNNLINDGSEEEILTTLIHELTHYSQIAKTGTFEYPSWLNEGLAVYSEIKYIDKYFPDFGGNIPTNLDLYNRKPNSETLKKWYDSNKDFDTANLLDTEIYPLYGFPINYYASKYGRSNLIKALNDMSSDISFKKEGKGILSTDELNSIVFNNLIKNTGQQLTKEDILFPNKVLYQSNQNQFNSEMQEFLIHSLSAEKLIEFRSQSKTVPEEKNKHSFGWIILTAIVLLIPIYFYFIKRFKNKHK